MQKKIEFYESEAEMEKASRTVLHKTAEYAAKEIKKSDKVLDVLTGYANFLIQIEKIRKMKITGIDNSNFIISAAKKNIRKNGLSDLIEIKKADAKNMPFPDNYFDAAVNYMGWGDVALTCGKLGIRKIIKEIARVLKPNGKIMISFPLVVEKPKNQIEITDEKIQIYLYGRKRHYPKRFFIKELKDNGIKLTSSKLFLYPDKRVSLEMSEKILKPHQKEVRKEFGIKSKSYEDVYKKFGKFIERYGYGGGNGIVVLVGQKAR